MKHTPTCLTVFFVLGLISPFTAYAQYNPQFYQNGTTSTTLAEIQTDDADDGTVAFILLGDGRFRLGQGNSITRQHNYPAASSSYTSKAYFVKKYKSDPPTARTTTVTTGSGSSSFANPEVEMNTPLKIGTSWSPSPSGEYYTILSISNKCSTSSVSGKIKYYFNANEQAFSTGSTDLIIYNSWISNASLKASDDSTFTAMLEADYANLDYNEIRHIYIRKQVQSSVSIGANLHTKLTATGLGCSFNTSCESSIETTKYPHDPNNKTVDKDWVCAKNLIPHDLNYKISFHNDGDFFANDILVHDTFEFKLMPNTVTLTNSSAPCVLLPNYPSVTFHFPSILLPGLNQTIPHLYTYEETVGFLTFSINTITCLPHNTSILNQASIVFDNQPPVETTVAKTITDETSCPISCPPAPLIKTVTDGGQFIPQPNPFNSEVSIAFTVASLWEIQIFDTQGRQVFRQSGDGEEHQQNITVNTGDWSKGIYFVRLQDGDLHQTSKIIKM
ncbi:MAG: T9SS type A sorting domain-containing protein [Phycisphaerae bacterium]|nr:T9SS type A sorting domain-containing protein [Saprospiraceae bacterium]